MDLNKVMLIGTLVANPEVRTTGGGQNVASLRIATNRRWKDRNTQELKDEAQFHNIVAWGKLAEICGQYLGKGRRVYIEGRLTHRNYQDQSGQKKFWTEVVAENMIILDRKEGGAPTMGAAPTGPAFNASRPAATASSINIPAPEEIPTINVDEDKEEIRVEDIPF